MAAISWGHSIEETARQLMEEITKARERRVLRAYDGPERCRRARAEPRLTGAL